MTHNFLRRQSLSERKRGRLLMAARWREVRLKIHILGKSTSTVTLVGMAENGAVGGRGTVAS